jgi:predicted metal-dependent hydrolase
MCSKQSRGRIRRRTCALALPSYKIVLYGAISATRTSTLTTPKHPGASPLRQFLQLFSPPQPPMPTLFDHLHTAPATPRGTPAARKPRASKSTASVSLVTVFEEQYRELRPRAPIPPLDVRFRRFTSLNTTIRLREGRLHVRLSDLLESAPDTVHHAIAHILLAKLYKKPISPAHADRYRRHVSSEAISRQAEHIRQTRGRKRLSTPVGHHYDLNEVFESLNARFFHGLLGRPTLTWSAHHARRMLGHYDAAHNTIVVSRVFDRADTPRCAIEYLLYHEMLHLKHPVRVKAGRRCVHSREFQAEERLFPELDAAKAYLKRL